LHTDDTDEKDYFLFGKYWISHKDLSLAESGEIGEGFFCTLLRRMGGKRMSRIGLIE
jgi:hypothetical protein